jgi:hypothetical protein
MIFLKYFCQKIGEKMALTPIFRRKLAKIAENCDHKNRPL